MDQHLAYLRSHISCNPPGIRDWPLWAASDPSSAWLPLVGWRPAPPVKVTPVCLTPDLSLERALLSLGAQETPFRLMRQQNLERKQVLERQLKQVLTPLLLVRVLPETVVQSRSRLSSTRRQQDQRRELLELSRRSTQGPRDQMCCTRQDRLLPNQRVARLHAPDKRQGH